MGWIQRNLKTSTQCTSRTICQWPLSKAEENHRLALITWSISRLIHCRQCTSLEATWLATICQWAWDCRAKASLEECQIPVLHQIAVEAAPRWIWWGQMASRCTQHRCTKQTLQAALWHNTKDTKEWTVRLWTMEGHTWASSFHLKTRSDRTKWTFRRIMSLQWDSTCIKDSSSKDRVSLILLTTTCLCHLMPSCTTKTGVTERALRITPMERWVDHQVAITKSVAKWS